MIDLGGVNGSPISIGNNNSHTFDVTSLISNPNVLAYVSDALLGTNFVGNDVNAQVARENMALMKQMNDENIAFQQRENEITRGREDTAVQRAAADMEAAGLSKTLAAGNPASAQALTAPQGQAIQNQFKYDAQIGKMNLASRVADLYFQSRSDERAQDLNDAQIAKLDAETQSELISNKYKEDVYKADIASKTADTEMTKVTIDYYKLQQEILSIEKEYKGLELQASIDAKLAEKTKDLAEADYSKARISLVVQQIVSEVMNQERVKILAAKDKQELVNLVRDYAYKYYQIESLKHDLNVGQKYGLPIGAMLNGDIGSWVNTIRSLLSGGKSVQFDLNGVSQNPDGTGFITDPITGLVDYY